MRARRRVGRGEGGGRARDGTGIIFRFGVGQEGQEDPARGVSLGDGEEPCRG